jgi:hypothetical protein
MTRYRLGATIDEAHMSSVLAAISVAGMRSELDPEITLSLMLVFGERRNPAPSPGEAAHALHAGLERAPSPRRTVKRTKRDNGSEWPAKGSIYDVVLEAVQGRPMTPQDLREVLKSRGFSPGSVNSSLGRLEKAGKVQRDGAGAWIVTLAHA